MQEVPLSVPNVTLPLIGLGTWKAHPDEVQVAIDTAIEAGYRHFDTAFNYNTEESLGNSLERVILRGIVKRSDLFITTKLPVFGNRASDVERFLTMSLAKLKMDYVDLYLIHMPFAFVCDTQTMQPARNEDGSVCLDLESNLLDTWKAMEAEVQRGRAKTIGLSNFNINQIRTIYKSAQIKPAVLQVEVHAYNQQRELIKACRELNIVVTAYAPLGSPCAKKHFREKYDYDKEIPELLNDPVVNKIAKELDKTPGQILLRFLTQNGVVAIPKSVNPERIKQNISIFDFELTNAQMSTLDALDRGEDGRFFDFMFFKGVLDHPEYPFDRSCGE